MNSLNQIVKGNFDTFFLFACGWVLFWIVTSVIYRKLNNKKIKNPKEKDIVYEDKSASGRSLKSWYTRLGGANRCLVITVTDSELIIRPFFPFNLMFLPEIFDLEHMINISDIANIQKEKSLFGEKVVIEFKKIKKSRIIELSPSDTNLFIKSISL